MGDIVELETERLRLRRWQEPDLAPFIELNADRAVMEHFPSVLDATEVELMLGRIQAHFDRHGFGLWATEVLETGCFIGFVGLAVPTWSASFTPCVEIGWRLAREAWGNGYAPEAARACLTFGYEELGLDEILSFTVPGNRKSRRVMEKIGMAHSPADDFEHPLIEPGHPLRRHVVYRLLKNDWRLETS